MALGALVILDLVLIILAIVFQILLYKIWSNNGIFMINMIFSLALAFFAFSAFPTNYVFQKTLAIIVGVIAIVAVVVKFSNDKFLMLSKVILSITMITSLILLLY